MLFRLMCISIKSWPFNGLWGYSPICLSSYLMDLESLPPHSFYFDCLNAILLLLPVCIDFSCCPKLWLWFSCITAEIDITQSQ